MNNAAELNEEDKPVWNEAFLPPPWSAELAQDFVAGDEGDDEYAVMSFGYDDETPVVCAGTKHWPLGREQALILAASLDTLKVCRDLDQHWTEDFADGPVGVKAMDVLDEGTRALWTSCRAAIAKAEGKGQ